jgi:hypothetical protein
VVARVELRLRGRRLVALAVEIPGLVVALRPDVWVAALVVAAVGAEVARVVVRGALAVLVLRQTQV